MNNILVSLPYPFVKCIELNRKHKKNALTQELMEELALEIESFENSEDKLLILTGGPDFFSAGVDLNEFVGETQSSMRAKDKIGKLWSRLGECSKPVLGKVSGMALGGGFELLLMCDLVVADESAFFGFPELFVGTIPGLGGTQKLPQMIGKSLAFDMFLTKRFLSAHEALAKGIVSSVVSADSLDQKIEEMAKSITHHPLDLLKTLKKAVGFGLRAHFENLDFEKNLFYKTFDTPYQKDCLERFLKKD